MNVRFVLRGSILALAMLAVAVIIAAATVRSGRLWPLDPTPPPPTILAAPGELPDGPVGLVEYAQYGEAAYQRVGAGFLLHLPDGQIVGVTTAHSVSFGGATPLRRIALGVAGRSTFAIEFDTLQGPPGQPRSGEDMTIDYVLLHSASDQLIDARLILEPDPRGAPQPGERVALFSGSGDGQGGRRIFEGTVQSADSRAVWVLMDESFDPSGLSGSPFLSEYTGRVVGMTIATSRREDRVLLSMHPIGSIVQKAQAAAAFPKLADYRR
jgi:hypothetical protein